MLQRNDIKLEIARNSLLKVSGDKHRKPRGADVYEVSSELVIKTWWSFPRSGTTVETTVGNGGH